MEPFFHKHSVLLDEKDALKMIKCHFHKALETKKEDPHSHEYCKELAKVAEMINDYLTIKGYHANMMR